MFWTHILEVVLRGILFFIWLARGCHHFLPHLSSDFFSQISYALAFIGFGRLYFPYNGCELAYSCFINP